MGNSDIVLIIIDFVQLALALVTFILSMRVVLRVEKRLDVFFKLLMLASVFVVAREIFEVLEHMQLISAAWFTRALEIIPLTIVIIALLIMNSIVMRLDGER